MIQTFEQFINESFLIKNKEFVPKNINFLDFSKIMKRGNFEGIVLLGAGGNPHEWINGVTEVLADEKIADSKDPMENWYGSYKLKTSNGRIDIALIFKKGAKLNMGKMAMWRLRFGDCSWISDYLDNYASQHVNESHEEYKSYWECSLKNNSSLEKKANDFKFKEEDEIIDFLKNKGYKGNVKLDHVQIETYYDGDDNSYEPSTLETKNITI